MKLNSTATQLRPTIGDSIEWTYRGVDFIGIVLRSPTRKMVTDDITGEEIHFAAARQLIPAQFLNVPIGVRAKRRTSTKLFPVMTFIKRHNATGYRYCGIKHVHVDFFKYRDTDITSKWISQYVKTGYLIKRPSSKIEGR